MSPTREQYRPRKVENVGDDATTKKVEHIGDDATSMSVISEKTLNVVNSDDLTPYLLLIF
jgi:hypothetical protein